MLQSAVTRVKQILSLQTTHYLPGYSTHILTYAYVFGYFPYVDAGVMGTIILLFLLQLVIETPR